MAVVVRIPIAGPFGEKPEIPEGRAKPFVIPPSRVLEFEVNGYGTPLQLVIGDAGEAKRNCKVILSFCSGDTVSHGPFTVNVTACEKGKGRELVFK